MDFFFRIVLNFTAFIILIQIFIGLLLMFLHFFSLFKNEVEFVEIFKQKKIRFKLIEHPIMMILGFLFFILFYKELYKNQHQKITYKVLFLFFLSVLAFIIRFPFNLI